jgi:exodeoxyribonuclease-3
MKIATWNVNSLKVRLPQLLSWLAEEDAPDILCLQELKLEDKNFPLEAIGKAGYDAAFAGQKTYNGVAILAKKALGGISAVRIGNPFFGDDQQRLIAADVAGLRVASVYVPNGAAIDDPKYAYKMDWLAGFMDFLHDEASRHPAFLVCGDYNIAPAPEDVFDPAAWEGQIMYSRPERQAFAQMLEIGFCDAFRLFPQASGSFTQWDYRRLAFQKNQGFRIDHILLSKALEGRCEAAGILRDLRKQERPSDHAPVWTKLSAAR